VTVTSPISLPISTIGSAQGSPTMAPLDDTMWDLILNALGGLGGGAAGVLYLRRSTRAARVAHWFQ